MANAFSPALYQVVFKSMYMVSRELVGMIGRVSMESTMERVGLNQSITSPVVNPVANQDIVPANISPEGTDTTPETVTLIINKQRKQSFHLTGGRGTGYHVKRHLHADHATADCQCLSRYH